jgi:tetratricopeptide (TPR) repeat protein
VDAAERSYLAALRGEETGMGRERQIALLDQAVSLAPRRSWYYETRAVYEIDLRRFGAALQDMNRVVALADRPYARFLRGLVRCQSGDYAGALPDFDLAIAKQPANTQFYRGRSLARGITGDAIGALQDAEHLVKAVPQQGESFYARGMAFSRLGRTEEALADFDRALSIRPELVYAAEARAEVYERLGDPQAGSARRLAAENRAQHDGCAACCDPFRY